MSDITASARQLPRALSKDSRSREFSEDINLNLNHHKRALRRSLYVALADAVREQQCSSSKASPLRVLDVGCGRGELLQLLSGEGYRVVGMDADSACVAATSQFATCLQGTIAESPALFAGEQFDTIVVSHVLEHLPDPFGALSTLGRMNASRYVFAVPNVHRPIRLVRALAGSSRCDHPRHIHGWGLPEFHALLTSAGFTDLRWYRDRVTINPLPGVLGAIVNRLVSPVEACLLPRVFPILSSSLIVSCRGKGQHESDDKTECGFPEREDRPQP